MDKLQPILKNHFWILLVPLLSMNLWGYFSANSALKAATSSRQSTLDSVKSGIPAGASDPNEKYSDELKKRNEVLEKYVDEELLGLWERQKTRMVWPPRVAASIPKVYKSEIKDRTVRFTYQKEYPDVIRKLHESVEPFVLNRKGITWTPKVDFPIQLIPQVAIGDMAIESKDMWNAQEDIWVTQFILDAIRQMNIDADSVSSAVIRKVNDFRLLGGDGQGVTEDAGAAEGESGMGGDMAAMAPSYGDMKGNGGPGGGLGGPNKAQAASAVKFNPAEEFGAGGEPVGGAAGGVGVPGSNMMAASAMSADMSGGGGEEGEGEEPTGPLRYVDEKEENPFVERGFYLSVIINQNKVVDFLATLANSEWPVRVVRFHLGRNPYAQDPFSSRSGGGAGMGAGMRMGRGFGAGGTPGLTGAMSANMSQAFGGGDTKGMSPGRVGGGRVPGMGAGAGLGNAGIPTDDLQHPDLVQLDLAGLMTIYKQPKSEIPEVGADGEKPAEGESASEAESETVSADGAEVAPTEEGAAADPAAMPVEEEMPAADAAVSPAEGDSATAEESEAAEMPAEAVDGDSVPPAIEPEVGPTETLPEAEVPEVPVDSAAEEGAAEPATESGDSSAPPADPATPEAGAADAPK